MKKAILIVCAVVVVVGFGSIAVAKVNIETVPVGNPGNAGEWSGGSYGGFGPDRICGAVNYDYNIGKYEVTAGQYTEFLNAVADTDTYGLYNTTMWSSVLGCKIQRSGSSGGYSYSVAADWSNRPVSDVSWGDAARFANWLHNGQPTGMQAPGTTEDGAYDVSATQQYYGPNGETPEYPTSDWYDLHAALLAINRESDWKWAITSEDEWYKAAYYNPGSSTYYDYPTSSNSVPSNNLVEPIDPGNNVTFYNSSGWTIGSPYYRTEVGAHENSDSPYGTFDQGGNVWEWNEAIIISVNSYRGLRGGSFGTDASAPELHASLRSYTYPSNDMSIVGFRVAQVPEPATFTLLALGGLAVLRRRSPGRRRLLRRRRRGMCK